MHLRHPDGFDDDHFEQFRAHCEVWRAYVCAVTANWAVLQSKGQPPEYEFFPPERSQDRRVVTLPVGGYHTLGSRAIFEDAAAWLLSDFFPLPFKLLLEEGLTESLRGDRGPETFWRPLVDRSKSGTRSLLPPRHPRSL